MAATRSAHTVWNGNLKEGDGTVTFDSSDLGEQPVTWAARTEDPQGRTSPEELIAAAQSSCYSMAFSNLLDGAGNPPTRLTTRTDVTFKPGTGITDVHITVEGEVPGLDQNGFASAAEEAKANCPVSQALAGTTITVSAKLV